VRWPKYITFQRQKRILYSRIKIPPIIAQFSSALERNQSKILFKLLKKYRPEDKKQKNERLLQEAKLKAESIFIFIEREKYRSIQTLSSKVWLESCDKVN
jgi:hypothetical protein